MDALYKMSQYKMSDAAKRHLKKMYAEKAELAQDEKTWDTPHDQEMSLADAQEAARAERRRFQLGRHSEGHTESQESNQGSQEDHHEERKG